jgi:methylmalonyl-CoA mutase N-terminal domain/subunit
MPDPKHPDRKQSFATDSGIPIDRFYTPGEFDYESKLGFPGEYPFTRGIYPTMYRGRLWTMRQYAGFASAEESNQRYRYLLSHGTTGLSVAFDLPTQMGYDADHPVAEGEVGKVGVAISSLEDMERLFDGIDLSTITTSMTINATAAILLCMYVALARKQGAPLTKLSGTIQNDILKEYIARGTYIYPPQPSMRLVTDVFAWCSENLPKWNLISISGYHIREAGATAVQELAFTLANAIEYVRAAVNAGLDVNRFGAQLSFFFNAHNNFFEEVAKFRAARRLWAKIMGDRFHATNPDAMKLRFHAQTGGSTLTAQQIDNNVARVTMQALSAVLGGCQSLHTNSKDEALSLPAEDTARLALRTQQIIAHESGVISTVDPLGGSYFVEYLTDEIERRAGEYIQKIDELGGAVAAIEKQFYQQEISASAYQYQRDIESKMKVIVGVNEYTAQGEVQPVVFSIDPTVRDRQIARLNELRRKRDESAVRNALQSLKNAAGGANNVVPEILTCVESYATLGEISDCLRSVWGEY